jgi:hypothetical protein
LRADAGETIGECGVTPKVGAPASAEEIVQQLVAADPEVLGDIGEDRCEGADTDGVVPRCGDVVLAAPAGRKTDMAPGLPSDLIPDLAERFRQPLAAEVARGNLMSRSLPRGRSATG